MTTEELLASFTKAELPWSEEAESALVSIIFNSPQKIEDCPPPDAFFHVHNRLFISTFHAMFHSGKPISLPSVTHELREMGKLDWVGGPSRLSDFYTAFVGVSNFDYFCGIVREKYQLRTMIAALASSIGSLLRFNDSEGVSATDTLQNVIKAVNEAVNDDGSPDLPFRPIGEILASVIDGIEERSRNPGRIPGISTGFKRLDEYSGGLEAGTLTVIAAKPSEGKSALCRQIIENACLEGHACDIFTIEMTDEQEVSRLICSQSGVNSQNMKLGMLTRGEQASIASKLPRIAKWDLRVIDASNHTIERICRSVVRRSRTLKKGQKLLVVVDYIQICLTSENSPNREREVAHITKTAKQCAKATGARFIMPSQLNDLNEARESRAIEQDADNFWMIIEPESEDQPKKSWQKKEPKQESEDRDLFLKKTRNGIRRKRVPLRSNLQCFRFEPKEPS